MVQHWNIYQFNLLYYCIKNKNSILNSIPINDTKGKKSPEVGKKQPKFDVLFVFHKTMVKPTSAVLNGETIDTFRSKSETRQE